MKTSCPGNAFCVALLLWLPVAVGCGDSGSMSASLAKLNELQAVQSIPVATEIPTAEEPLQLPNPERVNPFQQIDQPEIVSTSQSLKLKGFVESDRAKAVLLIGDKISIVEEDDVVGGFRIIQIKPPEMVFDQNGVKHRLTL